MGAGRRQCSSLVLLAILAFSQVALGQRNENAGTRSTGNGLLGNPTAGTLGGGGSGGGGGGGGRSSSFSTLGGSTMSNSNGGSSSRIGPIPEGEVTTIRTPTQFTAPQNMASNGNSNGGSNAGSNGNNNGNSNGGSNGNNNGDGNNQGGGGGPTQRSYDRYGGYWYSNRYYWRGGYWDGACYACGLWRSDNSGYPTCPPCQYYDPDQQLCITVQDCPNT